MDSRKNTMKHKERVKQLLTAVAAEILKRGEQHDNSKLGDIEKPYFDKATILKELTYGTPEYSKALEDLKPALDHHYANNSHHPEFYENGIDGMDLFDIIEMFFDWKAAGERHADGDIYKSLEINKRRFNMSDQLFNILNNTAKKMGY